MFEKYFAYFLIAVMVAIAITNVASSMSRTHQMTVCLERLDHQWNERNQCSFIDEKETNQ